MSVLKKRLIFKEFSFSHIPHFSPHGMEIYGNAYESQVKKFRKIGAFVAGAIMVSKTS